MAGTIYAMDIKIAPHKIKETLGSSYPMPEELKNLKIKEKRLNDVSGISLILLHKIRGETTTSIAINDGKISR